ncbi:MAG: putative Ig domain-containing protein, partial [Clostridia bacterium]
VSVSSDGTQGNNYSYRPTVSADGRYIAFKSYADNLISNDTNRCIDVFVKDMQTGTVQLISKNRIGEQSNSDISYMEIPPEISADGRYVQYDSYATNIAQFDFNSYNNKVFIFNRSSDTGSGTQIPDYTVPVGLSAQYGQSLSDVQLPYGFTWEDPLYTKVGSVGSNTFKVSYTPDDLLAYSIVTGIDVVIQVTKALPDYYVPSNLAADYGLTLADIELPAGFFWQNALTTSVGNAGARQFIATYTPTDTLNYEIVTDIAVTVLINKINPLYTIPTDLESEYLDTLADVFLPTGFTWKDKLTTSVGSAGTKQFMVTFTPDDTINYNTITGIPVSVIVNKLDPLYTVPTGLVAEYSDTLSEVALPSGFSWQDTGDTYVGNIGLNQFFVIYTPVDTINYNIIRDIQVQISVTKADPVFSVPTGLTAIYGNTLSDVILPSGFSWQDTLDTSVGNAGINPFLVTYTPSDTENYNVIRDISVNVNVSKVISRIEADTSGIQTMYNYNDSLDLDNLAVIIYYTDNTTLKVNYADFDAYSIRTRPSDGIKLNHYNNLVEIGLDSYSDEFSLVINKIATRIMIGGYPKGVYYKESLFDLKKTGAEILYSDGSFESVMWDGFEKFGIRIGYIFERKEDRVEFKYALRYGNLSQFFEFAIMTIEPITSIPVERILVPHESISFKSIGEIIKLRVSFFPSNASDTRLSFRSMDNSIATVNKYGDILAVGYGNTEIIISSLDKNAKVSIKVYVGKEFYIETTEIPEIVQGTPYYAKLSVAYGKAPFTWIAEGLPAGLSIDSSTGVISGTAESASPSVITANVFNVIVIDANKDRAEMSYSSKVSKNRVKIMNVGNILPDGYVNEQYKAVIEARYGTVPYVFTATNLPEGLSINSATGAISGIPTQKAYNVSIRVTVRQESGTDSWSDSVTFILSIKESDSILKINMDSSDKGSSATINANDLISYSNKDKEIIVETDRASYNLPVGTISGDSIKNAFGSDADFNDVEINIDIKEPDEDKIQFVESVEKSGKFNMMVPPVDFNVTLKYDGKTVEIDKFNVYIERRILIPSSINPYSISTAIVVEPDGKLKHVPTRIEYVNGQYYAVIKSRTNSTYVLIDKEVMFTDIEGHEAQSSIVNMARRLIVNGISADMFDPDGLVTRAQFCAMLSRALGISESLDTVQFTDVEKGSWYYEYVVAASSYNLVKRSRNNTFDPEMNITVGQAANALSSSMYLTGNGIIVSMDEYDEYTDIYLDKNKVSQSVLLSIARLKKAGIYFDYEDTKTHSNEYLTRADAVMMIEQMLKASGLID